ncbi:MAG: hypothetical protein M0T77_01365 [Actinomycetota bacterium]|nr:hypothetical protein [Actinomycetota bacterium]
MSKLLEPSQTARVVLKAGTLSGLDVLDLGRIECGAVVELTDGSNATVVNVEGKRVSTHGITSGSVTIRRDTGEVAHIASRDIAIVLRTPDAA